MDNLIPTCLVQQNILVKFLMFKSLENTKIQILVVLTSTDWFFVIFLKVENYRYIYCCYFVKYQLNRDIVREAMRKEQMKIQIRKSP